MSGNLSGPFNSRQILWLTIAGLGVTTLVAVAFLPPFVNEDWRPLTMAGYRQVCHQLPDRSFTIHGQPIALCHRCVGIWGSVPVAIALFALLPRRDSKLGSRPGLLILGSLIPLGVDWTADVLGIWTNTLFSRFITGAIFGLVAGYFLARAIVTGLGGKGVAAETSREPLKGRGQAPAAAQN